MSLKVKSTIRPLKPTRKRLFVLDQSLLPLKSEYIECANAKDVAKTIKAMAVRGAPAIGIAAAYGFYLAVYSQVENNRSVSESFLIKIKETLDKARPTAVNLSWATEIMLKEALLIINGLSAKKIKEQSLNLLLKLYEKAHKILEDDELSCAKMAELGADHIFKTIRPKRRGRYNILTHCNAGALATGGIGTALGVIRQLAANDRVNLVYADETRPWLQGLRLTAYELKKDKIPFTVIVDSMAGYMMQKGEIDLVVVGADRIASNGDVANKIGTYAVSVLAKEHNIPFFVAAPESTFDRSLKNGSEIHVEERASSEVTSVQGIAIHPNVAVINYSFDITPRKNVSAIFSEKKVYKS